MCNSWIYALPLTVLFALQATTSHAQEAIGKATSVIPQAEGSHAAPLSGGSNVYSKEMVRTGQGGQVDLQFKDNSNLKWAQIRACILINSSTTRTNPRV